MKTYRMLIIVLAAIFSSSLVRGQIGGLSASKLSNISSDVIPKNVIEFEPSISADFSKGYWNSNSNFSSYNSTDDSLITSSDLFFRFTYGAIKNFEIGFTVPSSVENIEIGAKYRIPFSFNRKTSFGALAGINFPLGNQGYRFSENNNGGKLFSYGIAGGIIISHSFTNDFSVDVNAIAQKNFPSENKDDYNSASVFGGADFGYYFIKGVQAILGFNYSDLKFNDADLEQYSLVINIGISIERAKNYSIALNSPITIMGKNIDKTLGLGFALTMVFN